MSLIVDEEPLENSGRKKWHVVSILFLNCWTNISKRGKGCSFFYSIWLNVYFLSRIPLLCYMTMMHTPSESSHYIRGVDWNSQHYYYCRAALSQAICHVLLSILEYWRGACRTVQAADGKDGCSFNILVCIKKMPSQCYVESLVYVFPWNFLQMCVATFLLYQLSLNKCGV